MNWISTDVHSFDILKWKRLPFAIAICLILVCIAPMSSCFPENKDEQNSRTTTRLADIPNTSDMLSNQNGFHSQHQKRKGSFSNVQHLKESSLNGPKYQRIYSIDEEEDNQKKNGKKLHHNNKRYKLNNFDNDYDNDEMAAKKVQKEADIINNLKYLESDKKYFDYFPIEDVELNEDPRDDDIKVVLLADNDINNSKKKKTKKYFDNNKTTRNLRRSKRGLSKFQNILESSNLEEDNQQENNPVVRRSTNYQVGNPNIEVYHTLGTQNDPWSNRFVRPVSPSYLPPPVYSSGTATLVKYPIPGIYYNPISPAGNYRPRPVSKPSSGGNTSGGGGTSVGNRFGGEDEEDRVIWDIVYTTRQPLKTNTGGPSSSVGGGGNSIDNQIPNNVAGPSSTRRPAPPLIHRPNRNQNDRTPSNSDNSAGSSGLGGNTINRPGGTISSQNPTRSPPPPQPPIQSSRPQQQQPKEPSRCVWAIVSCCSRNDLKIRYECFEQVGCHGAFWDLNPCADEYQDAAIEEAERFFD